MSKPNKPSNTEKFIKPLVTIGNKKHVLQAIFDGDPQEMPELKSVGVIKLASTNTWVDYVITTKGKEVVSIEVGEPNLRQIVEDVAKINFVEQFMSVEA